MKLTRRDAIRLGAFGASFGLLGGDLRAAGEYRVGVGRSTDPYEATQRAIDGSGEWNALNFTNRTVIIKPNLVGPKLATTGTTTDPEVVRAIVDRALTSGAREILIVETGVSGTPPFAQCGYTPFDSYDPQNRVHLVNLTAQPQVLAPLAGGSAYTAVYLPDTILDPQAIFVSAAKLKTHGDAVATLATKNLFGLPAVDRYISTPANGRFAMHDRSVHQTVVDLLRLRPIDFSVVDGIWGMAGAGPLFGFPVASNTVLAGRNSVAVDRVGVRAMGIAQWKVRHLDYAAQLGLGPMSLDGIVTGGDTLEPQSYLLPRLPPFVEFAGVWPAAFDALHGQNALAGLWYAQSCLRSIDVRRLSNETPAVEVIRTLRPATVYGPGLEWVVWDGLDEAGQPAAAGIYAIHVQAFAPDGTGRPMDQIRWVRVLGA